jgi:hypothetical protein
MGMEIERKFVVPLNEHDRFILRPGGTKIVQAYLSQEPDEAAVLAARLEVDEVLRTRLRDLNVLVTLKDKRTTTGEEKDEHRADKPLRAGCAE